MIPRLGPKQGLVILGLLLAATAIARVGGGESFSGGHSGGGGGDGGFFLQLIIWLIELIIYHPTVGIPLTIAIIIGLWWLNKNGGKPASYSSAGTSTDTAAQQDARSNLAKIGKYDPNFSEISFNDFVYALYGKMHEARGRGDLNNYTSYADPTALAQLVPAPPAIQDVKGVIVGRSQIDSVSDPDANETVTITVTFETNYTEVNFKGKENGFYVIEQWTFSRKRDVLSPKPDQITALHCPKCGGGLEKTDDGRCQYCGVKITGGDFAWFVTDISVLQKESRGPLLTSDVPEEGTDFPTVYQPNFDEAQAEFLARNPEFSKSHAETRFRAIFLALQSAWSSLKWEDARPYETDSMFQMHRYWIEAYKSQNLRNVLDQIEVETVEFVKFQTDPFCDAITVRIFAQMLDFTVDAQNKVVKGSNSSPRPFSEYWTFIRGKGAKENDKDAQTCPNCGAPLSVNMAGDCTHCGGKITRGDFDWVLSKIEQDEAYG